MSDPSPSPLFKTILDTFGSAGWRYRRVENRDVIECEFEAHHGKVFLHVQAFPQIGAVSVVAESPEEFPPGRRIPLAELLMRVNRQLSIGAFEMDWDAGHVSFRASNVFGEKPSPEIIASLVRTSVVEMDRLTPHLAIVSRHEGDMTDIPQLLAREDLLPQVGEEGAD